MYGTGSEMCVKCRVGTEALGRRGSSTWLRARGERRPPLLPTHLPALFSLSPLRLLSPSRGASSVANGRVRSGVVGSESQQSQEGRVKVQVTSGPQDVMIRGIVPPDFPPDDSRSPGIRYNHTCAELVLPLTKIRVPV